MRITPDKKRFLKSAKVTLGRFLFFMKPNERNSTTMLKMSVALTHENTGHAPCAITGDAEIKRRVLANEKCGGGKFMSGLTHQSQKRKGRPFFSMKLPQRGQRPGSFHGSTKCFGCTGQAGLNFCQTRCRDFDPSFRITGGISGRKKPGNFSGRLAVASARRTRVNTSNNSRQSRHTTVCTSQ